MQTTNSKTILKHIAMVSAVFLSSGTLLAQQKPAPAAPDAGKAEDEELIVLTPFEVSASEENGYAAATTLAGNRLNTDLRDLGNAVSVITGQFLKDIGATDNRTLLQYTTNTEVGNIYGNFAGRGDGPILTEDGTFTNPNQNTRVRGLTSADNTRDYFLTDIPWDGYNVDRVDLQRGPNSILFGQGSPAGIINSGTKQAKFRDSNEIVARYGSFGSYRFSIDLNRVLIKDELALRIAAVHDEEKYKPKPAYDLDRRIFGAVRWEPRLLKRGSARTVIKANFEAGSVSSNEPRSIPPIDRLTPWFNTGTYGGKYVYSPGKGTGAFPDWVPTVQYPALNKLTLNGSQAQDNNTNRPNHGQEVANINGGPNSGQANPWYQPYTGNFGQQFGSPMAFFNADGTTASPNGVLWTGEPGNSRFQRGGLGSNGAVDGVIGMENYQRPVAIDTAANVASKAGLPFGKFGVYKDASITDPSIFDFYNKLIDGPNKHEWQKWRAYNISLAQTFLNDQMGFEAVYNNEYYQNGQTGILSGDKVAIGVDMTNVYADGTPGGTGTWPDNVPFGDGTANPNVGRPFISDSSQFSDTQTTSSREDGRFTAFVTHDFARDGSNVFLRFLGKHTVTGLYSQDLLHRDSRSWQRYAADSSYRNRLLLPTDSASSFQFNANELTPNTYIYLGPTLLGASSAKNAHLSAPTAQAVITGGTIRIFDGTWNKSLNPSDPNYVDPAASLTNPYYPATWPDGTSAINTTTQSENPANYKGWTNVPFNLVDSEAAPGNRDINATSARLTKSRLFSRALVWQGHFWDNAIVGTWGVRKDVAKAYAFSEDTTATPDGHLRFDPGYYALPNSTSNRLEVTSHSWMVVAHLNQLPGLSKFADKLPIQVSLFYNKSTDFQPAAARVDLYNQPLAAPSGATTDKGILLETRDGKYSLKIGRYETSSVNATSSALDNTYFIGASQTWGGNWANRFEFNWTTDSASGAVAVNDPNNSMYNYGPGPGETLQQAQAREAAAVAGWRAWQKSVDPRFYTAWNINLADGPTKGLSYSQPNGFAISEDSVSKGYEIELNATPTKNWRLSVNASKTDAIRTNIGGAALIDFVQKYENALNNTPAGDLRIWWGGAGNDTTLIQWNSTFGSGFKQRTLQNGTNAPELREWRANGISNYTFDHGLLKGVNVGGGVRYQGPQIIGYKPIPDPAHPTTQVSFDLKNPYKAPSETDFDFWVGYSRRVWRNVDWQIQLNVRNAFVGNELIPITSQPDGTPATYRIRPPQTWQLTNTFSF